MDLENDAIMRILCLFANEFPYGYWEAYLETEIKYYDKFDKVFIFALQLRKEHAKTIRQIPENCIVIPVWYAAKWKYLINSFCVLTDENLYKEIRILRKKHQLNLKNVIDLFVFLSRANYEARIILKSIQHSDLENAVFYSYRFEYQPYVALLLRNRLGQHNIIIARAHRYDLYEERRPHKYIPCREILLENIDAVYPCSEDGTEYLQRKFSKYKDCIDVRFLGTCRHNKCQFEKDTTLRLVSCSNVVPVKRLDLIIDALKYVTEVNVRWTHFGDGVMLDEVKKLAEQLPENVVTDFRGNIKNDELMRIYEKESFDLFVNVSSSEGIPVSIMEAMSFGIPCIATDVGGSGEIVIDRYNGILLKDDFRIQDFIQALDWYLKMDSNTILELRKNVYLSWERKYNAETNYTEFVEELLYRLIEWI